MFSEAQSTREQHKGMCTVAGTASVPGSSELGIFDQES